MKAFPLVFLLALAFSPTAPAETWTVPSPDRHQTFAYGSEKHRQWFTHNRLLAFHIQFTNDPYVNETQPRLWDDSDFNFPQVRLNPAGTTFFYSPPHHAPVPVARRYSGFLGLKEVALLPNAQLQITKIHGLLLLDLFVSDDR